MFYCFKALSPVLIETLCGSVRRFYRYLHDGRRNYRRRCAVYGIDGCIAFAKAALPLLLIACLTAIVLTGAQTRFLFSAQKLAFQFRRLNPLEGLRKMFSLRALVELF
jgi:flagellar biosynthetic protein FlhB